MKYPTLKKSLIYFVFVVFCFITQQAISDPDDWKEEASKAIPLRAEKYTHPELQAIFKDHFHPEVMKEFDAYFAIMFQSDFPKPKHPNKTIIGGYQCLYTKVRDTQGLSEQEKKERQLEALHQLLAFHKKSITAKNPTLGEKIKVPPCPMCIKRSKEEFGIQQHTGYTENDEERGEQ